MSGSDPRPPSDSKRPEPAQPSGKRQTERPRAADPVVKAEGKGSGSRLVEPSLASIDALDCDTLAVGLCTDVRPLAGALGYVDWRMSGQISALVRSGVVTGALGEKVLVATLGRIAPVRILLMGWGPRQTLLENATKKLDAMIAVLESLGAKRIAFALPEPATMLLGLVDEHLQRPLGARLVTVFGPDPLLVPADKRDTRPIPIAEPTGSHKLPNG